MPLLTRLCGAIAAIGFVIALFVHGMTFAQVDVQTDYPLVWLLHLGCFLVFIPFVFATRSEFGPKPSFSQFRAALPGWAGVLLICVFAYAIVNFGLLFLHTEGGSPSESNGAFVLQSHGKVIRQLTEAEYHLQRAYIIRGFSGHWLVFYLVPALYFLFRSPRAEA
jgi:hypothetical protein